VIGRLRAAAQGRGVEVTSPPEVAPSPEVSTFPDGAATGDGRGDAVDRFSIPRRFLRVDLEKLARTERGIDELRQVIGRIHPHSVLHHGLSLTDAVVRLYSRTIPKKLASDCEIQILTPMNRGRAGAVALNRAIQESVNPPGSGRAELRLGERVFRVGDRVIQRRNNYDLRVFNGDIGRIVAADAGAMTCRVAFRAGAGEQFVTYTHADLVQLALAYATTIHKSQGSEFEAVIIPLVTQHYRMLSRCLVYTGLTRAKRLAFFVGERRALALAVRNTESAARQTALTHLLDRWVECGPQNPRSSYTG
jgi:exodeoxyribonuclease V alpha subunit